MLDFARTTSAIDDPKRGLGTGMSGRTKNWSLVLDLISQNIFFGYGFRTDKTVLQILIHNAYLRLFLQIGLIPSFLFITILVMQIIRMAKLSIKWSKIDDAKADVYRVIVAGIVMIMVNGLFESILINVGFPSPIMFLLLLVAPSKIRFTDIVTTNRDVIHRKHRYAQSSPASGKR